MNFTDASIRFFGAVTNFWERSIVVLSTNQKVGRFVILGLAPLPGIITALLLPESIASQMTFFQAMADILSLAVPAINRYSVASTWPAATKMVMLAFWLAVPLQAFVLTLIEYDLWRKGQVNRPFGTIKVLALSVLMIAMVFWFSILGLSPQAMASSSFAAAISTSRVFLAFYGMLFWSWGLAMGVGLIVHFFFLMAPNCKKGDGHGGS